ncbi:MAG: GNAT family N-acetyltransferase [Deltaproteobacteria bacterium]|nr:MAG: GNAT family N-acetyltransferase [Deltaproteobacteria bacterium]TMB35195.1 MAG: GNAT family N-acetyltransferase [Deltaproteobacteria bacterium]
MVRILTAEEVTARTGELGGILLDAVAGGASVSFLAGFSREDAESFYANAAREAAAGRRAVLAAFEGDALLGTVQLLLDTPPNQPHRAEVAKMLVHRSARRRGHARSLMLGIEAEAKARGRTLLTFDTMAGGAAEKLYLSLGYVRVGEIPRYALWPDGSGPGATAVFYKLLDM